jgi:hypothetical protein
MSVDRFDDMLSAIRAEAGDDDELAAATQLRVRRSLETRARSRHQLVGLLTAVGILLGGTVSWALATGHLAALWTPAPVEPGAAPAPPAPPPRPKRQALVEVPRPAPVPETVPPVEPPVARPEVKPAPRPAVRPAPPPVEALYRRAHELHFHGGDPGRTLAAWDAYLAAEPAGRFSVEARYNRALTLVRLGRYAEAEAALAPFARGEAPEAYRQAEAQKIVERLARLNGSRGSGDDAP